MKYLATFAMCLAVLAAPMTAGAQDEPRTLANVGASQPQPDEADEDTRERSRPIKALVEGNADHGDYGGPSMKLSGIDGDLAMLMGARAGWIIDHTVVLGLSGYLTANDVDARRRFDGESALVRFGYWGVFGEYIIATNEILHLTLDIFGGAGRASYVADTGSDSSAIPGQHTSVFVGEAGVNGELNLTRHLRLTLGGGYRYVDGPTVHGLSALDLSGFVATATFKVGRF